MELRDYLAVMRRRWLMIVAFLLVGIAGGATVTVLTTPQYASTTRLFVSTPVTDPNINALQGAQFSSTRTASYANLIEGNAVAQMVVDKLQLSQAPGDLLKEISATALPNTVIIEITATDPSPARAQQLSQTFAEVFSAYVPTLEGATPEGQTPIKATIVDAAPLPTTPVAPKPTLNIGLGALLGLFIGFGLAVLRETLDNTVKSAGLLEEMTESASLGAIMADNDAPKSPLVTQIPQTSGRVESFRVLRTNLQFVDADKPSRIFTITSAVPSEGKSTTAVNLAISLAQGGQRVALLETDLRRPRAAAYLKLEKSVGLTTVLIGRATLDDVIQPWGGDGLDVITSGSVPPNPAELLQSASFAAVLTELRQRYQIVIIDAPPLLPVTDAALVAAQTDGAILVVRFGKTTRDQVHGAMQRLASVGAAMLGSVLNFVPARGSRGYGYGYGYGYYGYGYGYAPEVPKTRREHRAAEKAEKAAVREGRAAGRAADRDAKRDLRRGGAGGGGVVAGGGERGGGGGVAGGGGAGAGGGVGTEVPGVAAAGSASGLGSRDAGARRWSGHAGDGASAVGAGALGSGAVGSSAVGSGVGRTPTGSMYGANPSDSAAVGAGAGAGAGVGAGTAGSAASGMRTARLTPRASMTGTGAVDAPRTFGHSTRGTSMPASPQPSAPEFPDTGSDARSQTAARSTRTASYSAPSPPAGHPSAPSTSASTPGASTPSASTTSAPATTASTSGAAATSTTANSAAGGLEARVAAAMRAEEKRAFQEFHADQRASTPPPYAPKRD